MESTANGETSDKIETPAHKEPPVTPPTKQEPVNQLQTTKRSKEEKSSRKKDDKSLDHVLKALSSLGTTEEKLAAMCKKYTEIVDENRKNTLSVKQSEKKILTLQREKEQLQGEQSKAVLTRSRLESLCRELQRQNKAIKEESLLKIREEEEKRKEVSAKFQSIINEISALTQQNNENNTKLRDENLEMQKKFKSVCEQYELREQQFEKISKQMSLEGQLADAKLQKSKLEMIAEKEILTQEKRQLLLELTAYQNKVQEMQQTEIALRGQISMYTDKYDEFQNALARSNQVYGGFKGEMEKMSKKITKLEKETSTWKLKWEGSHKALLQMAADKQQRESELALQNRKLDQLQKLCRTIQSDRSALLQQLKNEGITPKLPTPGQAEKDEIEVQNTKNEEKVSEDITLKNVSETINENTFQESLIEKETPTAENVEENISNAVEDCPVVSVSVVDSKLELSVENQSKEETTGGPAASEEIVTVEAKPVEVVVQTSEAVVLNETKSSEPVVTKVEHTPTKPEEAVVTNITCETEAHTKSQDNVLSTEPSNLKSKEVVVTNTSATPSTEITPKQSSATAEVQVVEQVATNVKPTNHNKPEEHKKTKESSGRKKKK